jgi:hypothetical protein
MGSRFQTSTIKTSILEKLGDEKLAKGERSAMFESSVI